MKDHEKALEALFGKDSTFVLATAADCVPSARVVDAYYQDGVFWIVTYAETAKVKEIEANPHVALCNNFHSFKGIARNAGHPLREENKAIREKLIQVFEPWYFEHNNENDEGMCYVEVKLVWGTFHWQGKGWRVNFEEGTVEEYPFAPEIAPDANPAGEVDVL